MDASTVTLTIGVLTFISGIASLIISRRKIDSDAHSQDADAFERFQATLTKLQERNDELYQENVALQVTVTTTTRRLQERDAQLSAATRQLDLLRDLARTAGITETLQKQLDSTNDVISKLQAAQKDLQQMVKDKEIAYQNLFESTRDLPKLPRPPKVAP